MDAVFLLSLIVFLPVIGAIVIAFLPKNSVEMIRYVTLAVTVLVLALVCGAMWAPFEVGAAKMQQAFNVPWIPSFNISYLMGVDGISLPLLVLTALVSVLAMGASWSIKKHVKAYCILFLLLETGMLGVFLALDFFLFYVFWELMLLPMYFLIGVWGGERREYAAIKFFLYTLLGSVLMLIAILMLYFASDLRELAKVSDLHGNENASVVWEDLHVDGDSEAEDSIASQLKSGNLVANWGENHPDSALALASRNSNLRVYVSSGGEETAVAINKDQNYIDIQLGDRASANDVVEAINDNPTVGAVLNASIVEGSSGDDLVQADAPLHTFNILALQAIGQHTGSFSKSLQIWAFILLFIGFAIKVPSVPVHTWLPDAHVEAPTPISMILAGVLLKMGGYGIIRICYPICPFGGYELAYIICFIGVISMIYGGFAALAQKDFKRMVAYSSVSHMGYVVLGLGVWSANAGTNFNPDYWNMGVKGAMFQMIGHGISSAGMFFMVGIIYDRVHHRQLDKFGGLFGKMPVYTALAIGLFFAGLGLPGLCGFIGEVLVVLSVWNYSYLLAVLSASVVVITAAYILWALQRVYLGVQYNGPHEEDIKPINLREGVIGGVLFVFAILLGVLPYHTVMKYMDATIDHQTTELAEWTRRQTIAGMIDAPEDDERKPVAGAIRITPVADTDRKNADNETEGNAQNHTDPDDGEHTHVGGHTGDDHSHGDDHTGEDHSHGDDHTGDDHSHTGDSHGDGDHSHAADETGDDDHSPDAPEQTNPVPVDTPPVPDTPAAEAVTPAVDEATTETQASEAVAP